MFSSQEIGLSLVLFEIIFEDPQSQLFRFNFHSPGSKFENSGMQPAYNVILTVSKFLNFFQKIV